MSGGRLLAAAEALPGRRTVRLVALGVTCLAAGPLGSGAAQAATYRVGTTADSPPGVSCDPSVAEAVCTLRQIIAFESQTAPQQPDTVEVPPGVYRLTGGPLTISTSVVVAGEHGPEQKEIVQESTTPDRVFDIQPPGGSVPSVSLERLTIAGGTADAANGLVGGDIRNAGVLTLRNDWITGGTASSGGGISNTGTLTVDHSLVSDNHASSGGGDSGGIQNLGNSSTPSGDAPARLVVETSTVSNNDARLGAGIFSSGDINNEVRIVNTTIAYNHTQAEGSLPERGPGAGLLLGTGGGTITVQNTIVADNTETPAGGSIPSNCSAPGGGLSSLGFNLESGTDCGFNAIGDLQSTDPQFSTTEPVGAGGSFDTLAIAETSPAIDHIPASAGGCGGTDQRLVVRPIGNGCEPGAYEFDGGGPSPPEPPPAFFLLSPGGMPQLTGPPSAGTRLPTAASTTSALFSASINPNGLSTTAHFEYGQETYASATAGQAVGSDLSNHTITLLVTGLLPNSRYHVRAVATNAAGTAQGADQVIVTPADPLPASPVLGKAVNVEPLSGVVLVKLPSLAKGQGFVPLTEDRQVPVGTDVDARGGTVRLSSAAIRRGITFSGEFHGGVFEALQRRSRRERGITELHLLTRGFPDAPNTRVCASAGKARVGRKSVTSARRHLSSRVLQLLHADVHGNFRTRGTYAAATVRGTSWDTVDRCDGTLTVVRRGTVVVHDIRLQRSIVLRAGESYLAKSVR